MWKLGHVFNHLGWGAEIAIDSGQKKQMAVNYQNRVPLLLQPLLQLPQLSSVPSDRRASGQPQMSQICVCCTGISGVPQFFPFISVMQLQDLKWIPTSYEHPFTVSFPVSELRPAPMNTTWLDDVLKEGSLQSPSKGSINVLQVLHQRSWCQTEKKQPLRTFTLKPLCLHSWGRPAGSTCKPKHVQQLLRIWQIHLNL